MGSRITRFAHDGVDILAGPEFHERYWGSTLWISPESAWQSADPSSHDSGPYVVTSEQSSAGRGGSLPLVMETASPSVIGDRRIHVAKSFDIASADGSVVITYSVQNAGRALVKLAPWEVTRLPGRQMSFFPYGSTARATDGIRVEVVDGVAWFQHSVHADPEGQKLWADGTEGWAAHVSGDLLFVKKFPDLTLAQAANDETDVEIYSSNSAKVPRAYIELEAQGPVAVLRPGECTSWTVRWYLMKIPSSLNVEMGSRKLVELARGL